MRGLLALARGDADGAADLIAPVRARPLASAAATRNATSSTRRCWPPPRMAAAAPGRALINERTMAKPVTPLTRHWIERLALPDEARA